MSDEMSADPHADDCEGVHHLSNEAGEVYAHFDVFWHDADVDTGWERGWYYGPCDASGWPHYTAEGPFSASEGAYENARIT